MVFTSFSKFEIARILVSFISNCRYNGSAKFAPLLAFVSAKNSHLPFEFIVVSSQPLFLNGSILFLTFGFPNMVLCLWY